MIYSVYIMTNFRNNVLYIGVTNNLLRRVYQHKSKEIDSFTKKYNLVKLVYYEVGDEILTMIEREKQIKSWGRKKKIELIEKTNSDWRDLYYDLLWD